MLHSRVTGQCGAASRWKAVMTEVPLATLVRAWQITMLAITWLVVGLALSHAENATAYFQALQIVLALEG